MRVRSESLVTGMRIALGVLLCGLMMSACSGTHPEQPPNSEQLIRQGETVFWQYCAECHQRDGSGWGGLYPRLAGNPIITLHDPEPIIVTVLYGQGSMPPFNDRLNPDDIAAVLSYIRNAWGNQAPAVSARQVH
jgi:mono/diheme cytochrome c family protein